MSDEERLNLSDKEDVDDLFGDDEEVDEVEDQANDQPEDEEEARSDTNSDEEEEEEELKTVDLALPRHAISQKPEDDTYSLKVPVFLNVEAHPFDPNDFKEKVNQNAQARAQTDLTEKQVKSELVTEKLMNENTIRWRYSNSGNDEIIKQSNAHFVQWSDGSVSLKVGTELFDFKELPVKDTFLVKTHDSYEILQNDSIITKTVNLIPASTHTSTHRKLTQAVKNIQKKDKILNTITNDDPLLKQRLADENERKTMKLKRQIELKRRLQEEKMDRGASPSVRGSSSYEREPAYERFARNYEEYDDDEDDFVANDDEEIEEGFDDDEEEEFEKGAERLKKLKEEGDSRYRKEEEDKSSRKRRRIIDSDDEE